jgi:2'-5' RNA ligase
MRLFTAINLPEDVRAHVARVQLRLREAVGGRVSWTAPHNFHITLKFLGEMQDERVNALRATVGAIAAQPMRLTIDRFQPFPPRGPARVLSLGCAGDVDAVANLFDRIQRAAAPFGVEVDRRRFTPHVTIARARDGVRVGEFSIEAGPPFVAASYELMKSTLTPDGPIYEVLESYQ